MFEQAHENSKLQANTSKTTAPTSVTPSNPKPIEQKMNNKAITSFNRDNSYVRTTNLKCFRCFQFGHKSNRSPNRKQLQLMEGEEDSELTVEIAATNVKVEEVDVDEGELLAYFLEKILLASRQITPSQ